MRIRNTLLAALMLAGATFSAHADEARSFTSIIRAEAEHPSEAARGFETLREDVACWISSVLFGVECRATDGDVSTANIDTALQLGPR